MGVSVNCKDLTRLAGAAQMLDQAAKTWSDNLGLAFAGRADGSIVVFDVTDGNDDEQRRYMGAVWFDPDRGEYRVTVP